jgi:sarcosine oxidase gamma subunit
VAPGKALVLGDAQDAEALRGALTRASEDAHGPVSVLDVSCGFAALALVGPQARELLARFCAIDARPALASPPAFRPGSIARTPGYLLVERPDSLLVLVGWALGAYLWELVADAAAGLGGGPVGAEALRRHLESGDA